MSSALFHACNVPVFKPAPTSLWGDLLTHVAVGVSAAVAPAFNMTNLLCKATDDSCCGQCTGAGSNPVRGYVCSGRLCCNCSIPCSGLAYLATTHHMDCWLDACPSAALLQLCTPRPVCVPVRPLSLPDLLCMAKGSDTPCELRGPNCVRTLDVGLMSDMMRNAPFQG